MAVKNQFRRDPHQVLFSQENLQKFFRALGFDDELCQNFFYRWHRQTRGRKRRFDLFLGLGFFGKQRNFRSRFFHHFSLRVELFLRGQFFQRGAESFAAYALSQARAQILAGDSREQRVLLLKSFDFFGNFLAHVLKQFSRDQRERFGGNNSHASRSMKFF